MKPAAKCRRNFGGPVMGLTSIANFESGRSKRGGAADKLVAKCLAAAAAGDIGAYHDLGVAFSTGSHGAACDLIEAHKWFNLAASKGHEEAGLCRADVSDEMTAREIAEAQRRAREWLCTGARRAA
jgi:TPR repeat protein